MDLSVVWLFSSAVAFIGTVVLREICMWLRNLIPKSVECWFCMHKTEVPYNLSNSWHCPKCEQYNGFTQDGDYNKAIDQQYDGKLNFSVSTFGRCKNAWRRENSLCNKCNRNQQLKVEQLAKFVPLSERNYDAEVEHFRAQIEKAYALCGNCEALLHTVLKREREEYCVPRRLNSTYIPKNPRGTWILLLNIVIALLMVLIGFIQTRGASIVKKELRDIVLPLLKKHVPAAYPYVIKMAPSVVRQAAIFLCNYLLLSGALLCLLSYYRTQRQPISLLFCSLTWLGLLAVSLYQETMPIVWLPFCQISFGVISSIVSFLVLKDIYADVRDQQLKQQTFLQPKMPKSMNYSPKTIPNGTSTPRGTPPGSRFSYVDSTTHSAKGSPGTDGDRGVPNHEVKWPGKYVGLEPGIRGLNLGPAAPRPRDDDVQSLWSANTVNLANSATYNPNASCWSLYSGVPNMTTRSAPVGPLMGFSSPNVYASNSSCGGQSRPTSPTQTIMSQTGSSFHSAAETTMRRRSMMLNTNVSSPSFR
uniref:Ima1 N-terminal domain-containing protein n=2 Tax=Lygus hesperus TaxID=30085 RepID=A0A0A9W0S3_LYGHE